MTSDLSGSDWAPLGDHTTPFEGDFDGETISFLTLLTISSSTVPAGLFRVTSGSVIGNVLSNVNITTNTMHVGALVGYAIHTQMMNIDVLGPIQLTSQGTSLVGGIAGHIYDNSEILDSRVINTNIEDIDLGNTTADGFIGGLVVLMKKIQE